MKSRTVTNTFLVILSFAVFHAAATVNASVFEKGKSVIISNVHVVDDDLYVYTSDFRMEGTVNGDLSVFAYDGKIQGHVSHAVNIFGRSVSHTGRCDGPFRSFSETLSMDGTVGGSATLIGLRILFNKGAVIERDLVARGAEVSVDGTVRGKLNVEADQVTITGQIVGDTRITCKKLWIKPPAVLSGNLIYESEEPPQIDSSGVTIVGTVTRTTPKLVPQSDTPIIKTIAMRLSGLCAAFLFGLILIRLFPTYAKVSCEQLRTRFAASLATGLLILGVVVACAFVLIMTLVAGIAGQILFSTGQAGTVFGVILTVFSILMLPITGFSAVSGAILFYAGRLFVALLIGNFILRRSVPQGGLPGSLPLFLGLLVLTLLFWIPIGGTIVYLFVAAVGAGAIMLGIRQCRKTVSPTDSSTLNTLP
jgi:cytoskeletal protein CcmA (bactofilin family)